MKEVKVIHIEIAGPVGSGKSAMVATIGEVLTSYGYCVAVPSREERNNPSENLSHGGPEQDKTVVVLSESVNI